MRHFPKTFLSKHGKFCGVDCDAHVNDHGNYGRPRKEAKQKQSSASDFKYSVKRRKKCGKGIPILIKRPTPNS